MLAMSKKEWGSDFGNLRKTVKGLGGSKRLTDATRDKTQNYNGIAIRHNAGKDVKTMKEAIWGAFFHVASSKENEWHDQCETGAGSWCKYQVDLVNKTSSYKPGPALPGDVSKHIKPILTDLTR